MLVCYGIASEGAAHACFSEDLLRHFVWYLKPLNRLAKRKWLAGLPFAVLMRDMRIRRKEYE